MVVSASLSNDCKCTRWMAFMRVSRPSESSRCWRTTTRKTAANCQE